MGEKRREEIRETRRTGRKVGEDGLEVEETINEKEKVDEVGER